MENKYDNIDDTVSLLLETEGARQPERVIRAGRATGVSNNNPTRDYVPDPEVSVKATRRRFPAQYKLSIIQKADNCTSPGQIGALLRKEGLYSSNLTAWQRQKERGTLEALSPKHRGQRRENLILQLGILQNLNEKITLSDKSSNRLKLLSKFKKISEMLNIPSNQTGEKI